MYDIGIERYHIHPKIWSAFPIPIFSNDEGLMIPYVEKRCVEGRDVWVGRSLNEATYETDDLFFSEDRNVVSLCLQVMKKHPYLDEEGLKRYLKM